MHKTRMPGGLQHINPAPGPDSAAMPCTASEVGIPSDAHACVRQIVPRGADWALEASHMCCRRCPPSSISGRFFLMQQRLFLHSRSTSSSSLRTSSPSRFTRCLGTPPGSACSWCVATLALGTHIRTAGSTCCVAITSDGHPAPHTTLRCYRANMCMRGFWRALSPSLRRIRHEAGEPHVRATHLHGRFSVYHCLVG